MILYWTANVLMFVAFTALAVWSYRRVTDKLAGNKFAAGKAYQNVIVAHTAIYGMYVVLHVGLLFTSHG